ncbi:ABC transporter substrate-binding protein [Tatumella citrea]|uniref:ABC transporter substrate-binding protein n=1 Tax=Tatumella citrea TaxID=53336 RepID=A0A1Y0LMU0_TATCI|nr:ABC transporter substrate-binding protein [Tatumella citrea]ARU95291.1 ABC transporter substrate-binding protein [Tatumella citrea]ARU99331.1 ABC transporter substrate-binding protein [Tatumella citrea]
MRSSVLSRRRFLALSSGLAATPLLGGFSSPLWAAQPASDSMAGMAGMIEAADNTKGGVADTSSLRLPEPFKLKLAINQSAICIAPVTVAQQQNLFSKYNLDVEFVNFGNSTDVLLQAIATGKADAGIGMALRWLKALEQGFDVKLTAGTHGGCLSLLTTTNSSYTSLSSLKGQSIGVTDMAGPDKNFFAILLKNHGVDPISDVQWKVYPADLMTRALDNGEIAAVSGSEPFSTRMLDTGKYKLLASNMTGEYANLSCCVIGVSGTLARKHKAAAAALTQSLLDAHSFAAKNPQKVGTEFMAHALNTTPQEVSAILMSQAHDHHAVGEVFVNEMTRYVTDLQRVQVISASVNPHQFAESIYANVFA